MTQRNFENVLIFGLIGASMFNPFAAVLAVFFVVAGQVAERYFTRNISDNDRVQIKIAFEKLSQLKVELDKHSEFISQQKIANSFRVGTTGGAQVRT